MSSTELSWQVFTIGLSTPPIGRAFDGYRGNRDVLSVLPVELWLEILHHATFVPGTLEPDIYHQTGTLGAYFNYRYYSVMLDALRTKCSLTLVCKRWRNLCTPLLYQSILIRDTRCLEVLAVTLARSRGQCSVSDDTSARPLGSFTTRLDLAQTLWREDDSDLLRRIMGGLPNLSVFSVSATGWATLGTSRCIIDDILSFAPHLRVLDWTWGIHPQDFERLLNNTPRLRMLRCLDIPLHHFATGDLLVAPPARIVVANITNLSIYEPFNPRGFCSYLIFPSLRDLSCHLWIQNTTTASAQEWFFERHGRNLTSLHLQQYASSPANNTRDLLWINERCPALRTLTISLRDWLELPVDPVNIPSIEFLGLRCALEGLRRRHYKVLFRFFESLDETSSTLRTVQFLDPVNVSRHVSSGRMSQVYEGFLSSEANLAWKIIWGGRWKPIL
ncbi:hypothetical protein BU15DRAFT_83527 [Melanogaster broomeanus]|nr:hypothetical protein BU15DRAFT_83527 [Melanogaster broomeanus]